MSRLSIYSLPKYLGAQQRCSEIFKFWLFLVLWIRLITMADTIEKSVMKYFTTEVMNTKVVYSIIETVGCMLCLVLFIISSSFESTQIL